MSDKVIADQFFSENFPIVEGKLYQLHFFLRFHSACKKVQSPRRIGSDGRERSLDYLEMVTEKSFSLSE